MIPHNRIQQHRSKIGRHFAAMATPSNSVARELQRKLLPGLAEHFTQIAREQETLRN